MISAVLALIAVMHAGALPAGPEKTPRADSRTIVMPSKIVKRSTEGQPYTVPMMLEPTQADFNRFIVLDNNGDGKTWKYMTAGYIKYDYNDNMDADDWAFIPFRLADDVNFIKLSVENRVQSSDYKESFEMAWGNAPAPDAMTTVIDVDNVANVQWKQSEAMFSIDGAGVYYLGVHANSVKGQYGLWIRNISLDLMNTPVPLSPEIESSSVESLGYSASVRMPSSTLQGRPIEGNVGLTVAVDGTETADYSDCAPGSLKDISLTLAKGTHTVTYTAYIMDGSEKSFSQPVADVVRAVSDEASTLPFFMEPSKDEFEQDCFVIDGNNDGNTWTYSVQEQSLQYSYNSNKADEWLILPAIDFGAKGGAFDLSVDAKAESAYSPESFEVCVSPTGNISDMTPMLSCTGITNTIWDTFTGKITVSEGGKWYVGIHCVSEADQWNLYVGNITITAAADNTPAMPVLKSMDLDGLTGTLTYTLPVLTVENKPLTLPVSLAVTVDGVELTRTQPSGAGTDVEVPVAFTIGRHTVTASAFVTDGEETLESSPVVTQITVNHPEGYVYELPFMMRPSAGEFETLVTLDANSSGIVWDYNSGADNGKGAMVCRTKESKASDAWVFFPKMAVTDVSRIYKISASVRAYLEQFPEDFDICIGTDATPESMTAVISRRGMNSYLYEEISAEYIVPEAGNYVIGIHRLSGGDAHTLSVYGVGMADSGKSANAPAAVTGISAKADMTGALAATVTFTMPEKAINGTAIEAETVLTAVVTSASGDKKTVNGKPGETVSVTVGARQGVTEFEVRVSSEAHGVGAAATVSAYCGYDWPSAPVVTSVGSEDNMSLTVSWTDAIVGANGGPVDVASLVHRIYVPADATGEMWNLVAEIPAGVSSYTYDVSSYAIQDVVFVGVAAVKEDTVEDKMSDLGLVYDVLGTPYPLPVTDDFSSGRYMYSPILTPTPTEEYSGNWFFDDPGLLIPALAVENVKALFCVNTADEHYDFARLSLPKFSTAGTPAARLTVNIYAAPTTPQVTVYADTYAKKGILIGEIDARSGNRWEEIQLDLPADVLDKGWVNFYFEVAFGEGSEAVIIKGYKVREVFEKQLETALIADSEMHIGDTYTVTGTVTNRSETAQQLPAVACSFGGVDIDAATSPVSTVAAPGETVRYTYTVSPDADMTGRHTIRFALVDYTDQVPADNVAETEVTVTAGSHPVVFDLTGEDDAEGVLTLSWTAPELKLTGNDDIEDYEAFDYASVIGQWLNVDRDGADVYGIGSGVSFPGQFQPKAFQVIDTSELPAGVVPAAYSGTKYFMVITPEQGAADDWLISPEVVGGSKVSFRLNILSEEYGAESIDVLYSTTGRSPEDFTLLKTFSQARVAWNPLEVTLPADARYFAFHYRCDDIFGVCLDDIFYSPVTDSEIAGYNIYCNGDKIADMHGATTYRHTGAKAGDLFNVSVVTSVAGENTEHPLSNTFVARMSGIGAVGVGAGSVSADTGMIFISGFAGKSATVYTPDGKLAAAVETLSDSERIQLPAGIYVVRIASHVAVKVAVK